MKEQEKRRKKNPKIILKAILLFTQRNVSPHIQLGLGKYLVLDILSDRTGDNCKPVKTQQSKERAVENQKPYQGDVLALWDARTGLLEIRWGLTVCCQ